MDLKIKDVAEFLNVSETTIRRWLSDGKIPAYKINHQYRFSRTEIENWVLSQKLHSDEKISPFNAHSEKHGERPPTSGVKQYSLYRAINRGQVLQNIPGKNKEEVIRETMSRMSRELDLDGEVLTDLLLDRENLMPTALNNGIAVPHTRDFLLDKHYDVVTVAYLDQPIEYGALDGKPVDILFFLFACEDRRHLNLLAKVAHLAGNSEVLKYLRSVPSKGQLLDYIKEWESEAIQTANV